MYYLDQLNNGLRIAAFRMPGKDSIAVGFWVKVGGRFETSRYAGISHFVEHMSFKGTKNRNTREIKENIEGLGGMLNAFTAEEVTCYYVKVLREHFSIAMDVLSDMLKHSLFKPVEVDKERSVILEEIKMYKDLPSHYVHDLIGMLLWPNQPLGQQLAGDEKSMNRIGRPELVEFVRRHYHPRNILVTVCGDLSYDEVRSEVEKYFSQVDRASESKYRKAVVKQSKPRLNLLDKKTEQTHFVIGLHGYSRFHPARYRAAILNILLGANMSSRLFEEVREKRGLAYEIKSGISFYLDTGSFTVSAGVETKKAPLTIRVILNELEKIKKRPVPEAELRRAKDYFMGQFYMSLEDTLDHMSWIGERALYNKDIPSREEIAAEIEKITARDITEVSRDLFKTNHLNLALIGSLTDKAKKQVERQFSLD